MVLFAVLKSLFDSNLLEFPFSTILIIHLHYYWFGLMVIDLIGNNLHHHHQHNFVGFIFGRPKIVGHHQKWWPFSLEDGVNLNCDLVNVAIQLLLNPIQLVGRLVHHHLFTSSLGGGHQQPRWPNLRWPLICWALLITTDVCCATHHFHHHHHHHQPYMHYSIDGSNHHQAKMIEPQPPQQQQRQQSSKQSPSGSRLFDTNSNVERSKRTILMNYDNVIAKHNNPSPTSPSNNQIVPMLNNDSGSAMILNPALTDETMTKQRQPPESSASLPMKDGGKNLCHLRNQSIIQRTSSSSSSSSSIMVAKSNGESIAMCGNDSDACFYLDSKCNGVSDCPNGFDESVEMCGCMDHEFQCNQTCIDSLLIVCDTKIDCQNGADEENCETYVCPETHFKCNNHFCIPTDNVCDFQDNCGDNSDEEACTHRACWFGEYKCDNGQCIQAYGVCNGQNDCVDGSDEKQCNPMDFVTCSQTGITVHRSLWCDGRTDCPINHEDELGCKEECGPNEFRCQNSRCLAMGNRCDTICDCAGTCEDEQNCDQFYTKIDGVDHCSPSKTISCSLSDDGKYVDRCLNNDHVCDGHNDCPRLFDDEYGCPYGGYTEPGCKQLEDHFWCPKEQRCLPLSVRCNHIQECTDGFDESDCVFDACEPDQFRCQNGQCIRAGKRCDSKFDCFDKSDEIDCHNHTCGAEQRRCRSGQCILDTMWCDYFVDCLDRSDEDTQQCRDHHRPSSYTVDCDNRNEFRCDNGQCIPGRFRCLLTEDPRQICADRSNLNGCRNFTCNQTTSVKCAGNFCVSQTLKCNERLDCPVLSDWADEQLCPFYCSDSRKCTCIDTTINCSDQRLTSIPGSIEDQILRMILKGNLLGQNLTLNMFNRLDRMHMIDLSENQIHYIPPGLFRKLWKLRILHLRKNMIEIIDSYTFTGLPHVGTLSLNGNRIKLIREHGFSGLASLKTLDLSNQRITSLNKNSFSGLRSLKNLDLSNNQITELLDGVFTGLTNVISIDLRGNKIKNVGSKTFQGLNTLKQITFDEFRFCCLVRHVENCYPPPNEFSSCEDLMSNTILRICIWCLGSIALIGNLFVILWRIKYQTINRVHSFLIINLALGDLLMGVYLLIIASVDSYYRGIYFIVDARWRQSSLCHFAGFLSTLSSEISVFFLIVITLDRLITITFPFRIYRIHSKEAKWIIVTLWLVAIVLSGLPLIPLEYFENFYGRSGVCLALHITHERPNGWEYSVFIFLVLNLISFTLICGSYLWMFFVARNTQMAASGRYVTAASTETKVQNRMARRMMFIVMTDFFCWMPIIMLSIVSLFGVRIPPQVFAWIAVFVLPLNAAVNPTLYTLSGLSWSGWNRNHNHNRSSKSTGCSPNSLLSHQSHHTITATNNNGNHNSNHTNNKPLSSANTMTSQITTAHHNSIDLRPSRKCSKSLLPQHHFHHDLDDVGDGDEGGKEDGTKIENHNHHHQHYHHQNQKNHNNNDDNDNDNDCAKTSYL